MMEVLSEKEVIQGPKITVAKSKGLRWGRGRGYSPSVGGTVESIPRAQRESGVS
jgi:hypothetical protein